MEETHHWRQMFDRDGRAAQPERALGQSRPPEAPARTGGGYDSGFEPQGEEPSLSEMADEAAMALAMDNAEYRPWILQRGRSRPAMMLHLRRHEPKSGLWVNWFFSYPHLVAVEGVGDRLLSLDFGSRQFMLEGAGLDELARHLQTGSVLMVQEYEPSIWQAQPGDRRISAIRKLNEGGK